MKHCHKMLKAKHQNLSKSSSKQQKTHVQTRWQVKCVCENPSRVRPNVLVASCGNKRGGTNKLKMIVVCIYMHSFKPFQLKQEGEYDVSNKKKRNEIMQCNIGRLWILPGEKYNTTELNFNEGQRKFPEYCVSGGTECAVTRLLKGFQ